MTPRTIVVDRDEPEPITHDERQRAIENREKIRAQYYPAKGGDRA